MVPDGLFAAQEGSPGHCRTGAALAARRNAAATRLSLSLVREVITSRAMKPSHAKMGGAYTT